VANAVLIHHLFQLGDRVVSLDKIWKGGHHGADIGHLFKLLHVSTSNIFAKLVMNGST
jgi:hypothetical protein